MERKTYVFGHGGMMKDDEIHNTYTTEYSNKRRFNI
jgi:hypothetical protein